MRTLALLFVAVTVSAQHLPPERIASSNCIGCHDGVIAPKVMQRLDHPFDFDYATKVSSSGGRLRRAAESSGLGSTVADDLLVAGRVECTSCHLSHEIETSNYARMRFVGPDGKGRSELCTSCHNLD